MKFNSEQSGRSMVEMLGVLAIIGVLSVAGIAGYSKAMAKFKQSKLMDQVSMTAANIRTAYSGQPSYNGLTTSVAQNLGLLDEMKVAAGSYKNSYGGGVTAAATSGDDTSFELTFTQIPLNACVAIGSADWGYGSGGLVSLTIGSTGLTATGSLADVGTACAAGGDTNTMKWTYR